MRMRTKEKREDYAEHLWSISRPFMPRQQCLDIVSSRAKMSVEVTKRVLEERGVYY